MRNGVREEKEQQVSILAPVSKHRRWHRHEAYAIAVAKLAAVVENK